MQFARARLPDRRRQPVAGAHKLAYSITIISALAGAANFQSSAARKRKEKREKQVDNRVCKCWTLDLGAFLTGTKLAYRLADWLAGWISPLHSAQVLWQPLSRCAKLSIIRQRALAHDPESLSSEHTGVGDREREACFLENFSFLARLADRGRLCVR